MKHTFNRGINTKALIFNSLMFLLIIYFVFHSISGERGIIAFTKLKKQLLVQQEQLEDLRKQRHKLEAIVKSINPKTLDKDMLDEVARRDLGLIGKDEKMIVLDRE